MEYRTSKIKTNNNCIYSIKLYINILCILKSNYKYSNQTKSINAKSLTTIPLNFSAEIAQNAYSFARNLIYQILYSIFSNSRGLPVLSGNMIGMRLSFKLAPQVESMVMHVESWSDISVR